MLYKSKDKLFRICNFKKITLIFSICVLLNINTVLNLKSYAATSSGHVNTKNLKLTSNTKELEGLDIENIKNTISYLVNNFEDRSIGSEDNKNAALYLFSLALTYDLVPQYQEFTANPLASSNNNYVNLEKIVSGNNIIIKNKNYNANKKDVVFVGHFDTVVNTPGANDNASGAAMALEFGRYLKDKELSYNPIVLLCNSEEAKMAGSRFFVTNLSEEEKDNIELAIVFDMVGSGDHYEIWNTSYEKQGEFYTHKGIEIANEMELNLLTLISENGNSDYRHFEFNDIPTFTIMADGDKDYHKPTDGYHKIMNEYLINISNLTLELLKYIN